MSYSRAEQETTVVWDEEDKVARIYSSSSVSLRKLEGLCAKYPDEYRRVWEERDGEGRLTAAKYVTGCKRIRFARPASEAVRENGKRLAAAAAEKRNTTV